MVGRKERIAVHSLTYLINIYCMSMMSKTQVLALGTKQWLEQESPGSPDTFICVRGWTVSKYSDNNIIDEAKGHEEK